ncbi:RiPP maturation radical SAM C-methyltransferase [Bacillus sp. CDB3]|uniref:RiPP maturation radical SAM C-methyltransferase n=1 Tax=Bacillus sp. CDB3 TaxID=360310 RepID=UPI0015C4D947|nr:RiPP maturation radical SAM C-methyltransferase [Bacillus sp. CDB3]
MFLDKELRSSSSVVLVSLPWTSLTEPSLGLGILRAVLDQERIPCRVLHLNIFLLEHLRADSYYALANVYALNDFLFSGVLDSEVSTKQLQWLRLKTSELLAYEQIDDKQYGGLDGVVHELLRLRQEVIPKWLAGWADQIAESNVTLVGLTCMFDQTIAALALAHLIKQRAPEKLIALGGYAVRSPTGEALLRSFSCIDVVCMGEGEPVMVPLALASAGLLPLSDVPSIIYRGTSGELQTTTMAPAVDMNTCPVPNYADFFADLRLLSDQHNVKIEVDRLPVENSRGCWWGQKKHCVFCGIHDSDLVYRSRNAEKVLEVMDALAERYGFRSFRFSDYILPHQYFKTLLPKLVERQRPYSIIAEIKANQNKERVALLANAGFDEVQPGIESFSSDVLLKMNKGVTGVQNIHTLLMGKRYGVTIRYNLLYGLPNDDPAEIAAMLDALPLLFHLDIPATRLQIQVTRYAPLQVDPERFGIPVAMYEPSYDLIFSSQFLDETGFDLNDFCYYYEIPFENAPSLHRLYAEIDRTVDAWTLAQRQREVTLWYQEVPEGLEIFDSRSEPPVMSRLSDIETKIYRLMEEPIAIETLRQRCHEISDNEFKRAWKRLEELGLFFQDRESVIGLALPKELQPDVNNSPVNELKVFGKRIHFQTDKI